MTAPLKIYDAFKADYPDLFFSFDEKDERGNVLTNVDDNPLSFYTREKLENLMTKTTKQAAITFYSNYKNYNSNIFYTIYTPHSAPPPTTPTPTLSGADAGGLKSRYFKEFQEIEDKKRKEEERDLKIKALEEKFQNRRQLITLAGVVLQALIQNNAAPIARPPQRHHRRYPKPGVFPLLPQP